MTSQWKPSQSPRRVPLIRRGDLSGRWYAVTRWHRSGDLLVADEKFDVTDQILKIQEAAWDEGMKASGIQLPSLPTKQPSNPYRQGSRGEDE